MKFFAMWWEKQHDRKKEQVRELIRNGQLELVNGGWSMHDEACPTYGEMINNMVMGHQFIQKEFGEETAAKMKIGWQLDDFGHSNTNFKLMADLEYDAVFFARVHYQKFK